MADIEWPIMQNLVWAQSEWLKVAQATHVSAVTLRPWAGHGSVNNNDDGHDDNDDGHKDDQSNFAIL